MSHLTVLKQAIRQYRPDAYLTVDDIRHELTDLAHLRGTEMGSVFVEAVAKHYLVDTGLTARTRHRPGKGRRICVYQITEKAFVEQDQEADR